MDTSNSVQDRLVAALESFLHISHESRNGPSLDAFAAHWQSLYNETTEEHADLAYNVAGAIDVVCETLMQLSVVEDDVAEQVEKDHDAVKAQLIPQHTTTLKVRKPSPSPFPSSPSSRESSPIDASSSLRWSTAMPPSPIHAQQPADCTLPGLQTPLLGTRSKHAPSDPSLILPQDNELEGNMLPGASAGYKDLAIGGVTCNTTLTSQASYSSRTSMPPLLDTAQGISSRLPSPATSEHYAERRISPRIQSVGSDSDVASDSNPDTIEDYTSASMEEKNSPTVVIEAQETQSSLITPPGTPSRSPSPSTESNNHTELSSPPTGKIQQHSSVTHAFIRPLLTHLVEKPYNFYPSKTLISEIALSSDTSEKDINAYLSQLRSRLGWNAIRKKYFPPTQWSINEMLAWLDGYWQYTHSELPALKDYDFFMGADGISGTMCGLDVRLAVLYDDLRGIYDRMTRREGEGSDLGKAIKEGVKWSGKHEWEKKRKELEKQGEALRKVQREEERSLKRKHVDDEDYDDEGAARQVPRARVVSAPQPQSKKRGRSESPESEDDGDSTPPPPAKRHCSLPTMSLSTPPDLDNWFKVQTPMSTWDAPVTLKAFSYDAMPMPSLVDDDSDSERGSSVGPSTPDSSEHVDLPSFDFSSLVQPMDYGGMSKPFELNVPTLPDVAFPELLNAQNLNIDLFAGLSAAPASTGKDLPSLSSSDQFISIPTSDEAPFDFGDPQSWSFNYEGLDLGSMGFDLNFGLDGV